MGQVVRFLDPAKEKIFTKAENAAIESLYTLLAEDKGVHDITIALARTAYQCFIAFYNNGLSADEVCQEIDYFLNQMKENLSQLMAYLQTLHVKKCLDMEREDESN